MMAETFLDTSILLEAANGGAASADRQAVAQGLLTTPFGVSAQVLTEFYDLATTANPTPLTPDTATRWIELLSQKSVQSCDANLVQAAIALAEQHAIPVCDATILAAAERLGCKTVYSERLTQGQTYGSVRVVNPFLDDTPAKEG